MTRTHGHIPHNEQLVEHGHILISRREHGHTHNEQLVEQGLIPISRTEHGHT